MFTSHCFHASGAHPCPGAGLSVFFSPDGFRWNEAEGAQSFVTGSDTFNVAFYDPRYEQYAGYIRIDDAKPNPHESQCAAQPDLRRIGRCQFASLHGSWGCDNTNASTVFSFDADDPLCLDFFEFATA